ncbi:head maturation protease [Staphylococcus phage S-CoN_Ph13]|nr:head maturation protease [Staphylococcus phage S-CoN_Ph13]
MAKVEFRMHDAKMTSEGDMIVAGYVNQTEQFSQELGLAKRFKEKFQKVHSNVPFQNQIEILTS